MADVLKIFAQLSPAATTLTALYTVPSATSAVVSSLTVCNTNTTPITFRIAISATGAADNIKHYLYRDLLVPANDTFIATIGITLATTDVVRCYASATNVAFQLFGTEVT